jgi:hypothetical protein
MSKLFILTVLVSFSFQVMAQRSETQFAQDREELRRQHQERVRSINEGLKVRPTREEEEWMFNASQQRRNADLSPEGSSRVHELPEGSSRVIDLGVPGPLLDFLEEEKTDTKTCVWSDDHARKILTQPGCRTADSKEMCNGYVVCKSLTGLKQVKMATCSAENCGDNSGARCAAEKGFRSRDYEKPSKASDKKKAPSRTSRQ